MLVPLEEDYFMISFLNKYNTKNSRKLLISHPSIALNNAKKHFVLSDKEKEYY